MLYKILLILELQDISQCEKIKISQKFEQLYWLSLNDANTIWISEKQASDLISAKIKIERDLNLMYRVCSLKEIKYAFQLSLGEISTGKLKKSI